MFQSEGVVAFSFASAACHFTLIACTLSHRMYVAGQFINLAIVVAMVCQSALSPSSQLRRHKLSATIWLSATSEIAFNLMCR